MAFITFAGSSPTNALTAEDYHIQIAHPDVADTLILMEHASGSEPYTRSRTGWPQAGERNIRGKLTVTGSLDKIAAEWQANFLAKRPQWELFEALLLAQQTSPCTLLDRFNGETDAKLVWLQVDQQYLTPWIMGQVWNLQFRALEEK